MLVIHNIIHSGRASPSTFVLNTLWKTEEMDWIPQVEEEDTQQTDIEISFQKYGFV